MPTDKPMISPMRRRFRGGFAVITAAESTAGADGADALGAGVGAAAGVGGAGGDEGIDAGGTGVAERADGAGAGVGCSGSFIAGIGTVGATTGFAGCAGGAGCCGCGGCADCCSAIPAIDWPHLGQALAAGDTGPPHPGHLKSCVMASLPRPEITPPGTGCQLERGGFVRSRAKQKWGWWLLLASEAWDQGAFRTQRTGSWPSMPAKSTVPLPK
jgi:hypothetical protein